MAHDRPRIVISLVLRLEFRFMKNRDQKTLDRKLKAPLVTPTDLAPDGTKDIAGAMNAVLADVFALYLKTKNFHWHMSGPHFRDYHLMLDERSDQLFAISAPIAERARKPGRRTLRCLGQIARAPRVPDT